MVNYTHALTIIVNETIDDDNNECEEWEEFMTIIGDDDDDLFSDDYETSKKIKQRWSHTRQNWNLHVAQLVHEGYFKNEYRMSFNAWNRLYAILSSKLKRKRSKSRSMYPMSINLIMATGMRWLTGIPMNGVRHMFKMSRTEVYRSSNLFLEAVLTNRELDINLPKNPQQWDDVKLGFNKRSKDGVLNGCCGAIDGLFIKTTRPIYYEAHNIRAYYSGHYEHYGLNCQAVCDANLKFLFFGVVSPGSTNDNVSYTYTGNLRDIVEGLTTGNFLVGDAAYTVTEHLLIPFIGSQRDNKKNDTFNFYLSQLRIRIEMAFGLLVNKFRILKQPLPYRLNKNSKIVMVCARLHNFIIDNDGSKIQDDNNTGNINPNKLQNVNGEHLEKIIGSPGNQMVYLPTMRENDYNEIPGISITRKCIVDHLAKHNYTRPNHNLLRNSRFRTMRKIGKDINGSREYVYDENHFHPI